MNTAQIRFVFDGVSYTVSLDELLAANENRILLPNGKLLSFEGLFHKSPPKLRTLQYSFTIEVTPATVLKKIAKELGAVLAQELGYCPDHPEEHDNYCSKCGKKITSPTIKPFKPPFLFTTNQETSPNALEVMGNGPCPNCHKPLDHGKDHGKNCPHCGQILKWICRSS